MSELHIIIGCMFSGKTSELLKIANRYNSIKNSVILINFEEDNRYSDTEVKTHDLYSVNLPTLFVKNLEDCNVDNYDIICINEAQFFSDLITFCKKLLTKNKKIYIAGLDGDFKQEIFGEILLLIPLCNTITRLNAYCKICNNGTLAYFTKRKSENKEQKLIGTDEYIPVCRNHL